MAHFGLVMNRYGLWLWGVHTEHCSNTVHSYDSLWFSYDSLWLSYGMYCSLFFSHNLVTTHFGFSYGTFWFGYGGVHMVCPMLVMPHFGLVMPHFGLVTTHFGLGYDSLWLRGVGVHIVVLPLYLLMRLALMNFIHFHCTYVLHKLEITYKFIMRRNVLCA